MISAKELIDKHWKDEIDQESAFSFYMNEKIIFGKLYKSPLRVDRNPTCSFWYSQRGILYLNDFGVSKMYSVVDLVKIKFGLNYTQAIAKLRKDAELMPEVIPAKKPEELVFNFTTAPLQEHFDYWKRYKLPLSIVSKYCFFAKSLYRNDDFIGRSTTTNPIYIYKFISGNIKIYRPLDTNGKKWGGNAKSTDIGGMFQLPTKGQCLIITSSIKDIMVLRQHGFNAICFNAEGVGTTGLSAANLRPYVKGLRRRFKHIFILLDNDAAGKRFALSLSKMLGVDFLELPEGPKDISDYQKQYGVRRTHKIIRKLIKTCLKNYQDPNSYISSIPFYHS